MEWAKLIITILGYAGAFLFGRYQGQTEAYSDCINRMQQAENCLLDIINDLYQRLAKRREEN